MKKTIAEINRFKILDEQTLTAFYGFNQEWYSSKWKKTAGCGPTIASSIYLYLSFFSENQTKKECIPLQEMLWSYVKPSIFGISTIVEFKNKFEKFTNEHEPSITFKMFEVLKKKDNNKQEFINFIMDEINNNHPIAFLNRDNGNQKNLDRWHWTIIVGYEKLEDELMVDVIDNGDLITINSSQWYDSTRLGGGCVSVFHKEEEI